MNILLVLSLVLIPTVLAQSKTGCVKLKNRNFGGYLTSSKTVDDKTRHVAALEEDDGEEWEITDVGGGQYTIMNKEYDAYLFASSDTMSHNYYVYLWLPESGVSAHKWKITKQDKYYIIENVQRKSCLIQGSGTWVYSMKAQRCDVAKMFQWKMENC